MVALGRDAVARSEALRQTPLRRQNRAQSPAPVAPKPPVSNGVIADGKPRTAPSAATPSAASSRRILRNCNHRWSRTLSIGFSKGFFILFVGGLTVLLFPDIRHGGSAPPWTQWGGSAVHWHALQTRLDNAFACSRSLNDVLDIVSGAPYEFGSELAEEPLLALQRSVSAAASVSNDVSAGGDGLRELALKPASGAEMEELREAIWQLLRSTARAEDTATSPAGVLHQRLLAAISEPCDADVACTYGDAVVAARTGCSWLATVPLEIDPNFTSPSAVPRSGWLHRTLLAAGAATGLPNFRARAQRFKPRPASVVLATGKIVAGDCLALRGSASYLAFRVVGAAAAGTASGVGGGGGGGGEGVAVVRHFVIEQLPRLAAPRPQTSPRRFMVYGHPASAETWIDADDKAMNATQPPYTIFLGAFEYSLAAPASQVFALPTHGGALRGLRIVFEGPGWGNAADYICVYRIRAFE